jgi:nucleoside-diphosphate-sugar epimerase
MSSHAQSYGLIAPYTTIALFGANGQIGSHILEALLSTNRHTFRVTAFVPPGSNLPQTSNPNVTVKTFDIKKASRETLARDLTGIEAIVSALNGPALEAQCILQDAAADAGVKRFYPSEYGFHQIYRKPNDPMGYIHPAWNTKAEANERAILHPAIRSGAMSFTMIGCGDFYNQTREKVWCPWTQSPSSVDKYVVHVIGDPDAEADYTHLADFANFLVATLLEPAKSENQSLNIVSDTISHTKIAQLLEKYTGKKVELDVQGEEAMHRVWENPTSAPKEHTESAFPVDFWYLVKGTQGKGLFVRPKSQIHNGMFPDVKITPFEGYFKERSKTEGKL